MSNCFPKRHFCIFSIILVVVLLGNRAFSQPIAHIHLVSTHEKIGISKKFEINLKQSTRNIGMDCHVDYFVHPLVGKLPPIAYNDSLPFFSTTMRKYRDAFFNNSHKKRANDLYLFLTKDTLGSFYIPGKNIVFISANGREPLEEKVFRMILASRGKIEGVDTLSMDSLAVKFNRLDSVDKVSIPSFSYNDDTENLASSVGLVAYGFWEKNGDGSISLKQGLHFPFKLNTGKVNLDIDNYWLRPFYISKYRFIAPVHLGLVGLAFFIMLVFRKKVNERADKVLKIRSKIALKVLRTFLWILFFVIGYLVFWTTDSLYKRLFFNSTQYENLGNMNLTDFKRHLTASSSVIDQPTTRIFWEVYTKEHQQWKMKRMKKVLYFKVLLDSLGNKLSLRFSGDSEEIRWGNQSKKAQTHLIVYSYYNTQGQFIGEEIFNYAGNSLEKKFKQKDPAKRILVFVNGYRPVANGGTPSDALLRVQKNGIEFPDSKNICYTNDRFNYWGPWGGFDQKFIDRIKPNEVYYADGHHSVATSNYGSILEFVQTASDYPKPCKGTHHCTYYTKSGKRKKTIRQLPFTPNTRGFLERRQNGKIAGKNLLQLLNEVPGNSRNDTLYLVAHSMGFAYALGMIDALGKACQYKTFFVIAPENAESGKINARQWHRVFQYGCFTSGPLMQPACLQDGVAPQSGIRGLPSAFRFTFPTDYHKKMGFTGSHFVGYYDWIFKLPPHQEGAVQQN